MNCPACNTHSHQRLNKQNVWYFQCPYCETLFSGALPNDNMVGGGMELERNIQQNGGRLSRFLNLVQSDAKMLDFGCGSGMLVDFLKSKGYNSYGYDKFNPKYDVVKSYNFDLISMVEVIEHLSSPFSELEHIHWLLNKDGILYIETSFIDVAREENIALEDFFYINPKVGHSTIFSHMGLDILMIKKGFLPLNHINRNTRIYKKATEI